jgi:hypothetical protein
MKQKMKQYGVLEMVLHGKKAFIETREKEIEAEIRMKRLKLVELNQGLDEGTVDPAEKQPVKDAIEKKRVKEVNQEIYLALSLEWKRADNVELELMEMFANIMQPSMWSKVEHLETPKEIWDELEAHFNRLKVETKTRLTDRLNGMQLGRRKVQQLVQEISEICSELKELGITFDEDHQFHVLCGALPTEYAVMAETARGQSISYAQKVAIITRKELELEKKRTSKHINNIGGQPTQTPGKQPGTQKKGLVCFKCGKEGHFKRSCPEFTKTDGAGKTKYVGQIDQGARIKELEEQLAKLKGRGTEKPNKSPSHYMLSDGILGHVSKSERAYADSGAQLSVTPSLEILQNVRLLEVPCVVNMADSLTKYECTLAGEVHIPLDNSEEPMVIKEVYYCPEIAKTLIAVADMTDAGYEIRFSKYATSIYLSGKQVGRMNVSRRLSYTEVPLVSNEKGVYGISSAKLWHERMGHLGIQNLKRLPNAVVGMPKLDMDMDVICTGCMEGRQEREPFKPRNKESAVKMKPGEMLHSDIWGPAREPAMDTRARYFITLMDECTGYTFVDVMERKSEASECIISTINFIETQTGNKVKVLRSDNGREYLTERLRGYFEDKGIWHQKTIPGKSQQNGRAERLNRTLVDCANSMLQDAGLLQDLWAEALVTAVKVYNRTLPKDPEKKTRYELFWGAKPDVSRFRRFGCEAHTLIDYPEREGKFGKRSRKCIMIGYADDQKGYRLMEIETGRVYVSRDVKFNESRLPAKEREPIAAEEDYENSQVANPKVVHWQDEYTLNNDSADMHEEIGKAPYIPQADDDEDNDSVESNSDHDDDSVETTSEAEGESSVDSESIYQDPLTDEESPRNECPEVQGANIDDALPQQDVLEQIVEEHTSQEIAQEEIPAIEPRRSSRRIGSKPRVNYREYGENDIFSVDVDSEPTSIKEAMSREDWPLWRQAIEEEFESFQSNGTAILVDLPKGKTAMSGKLVFQYKRDNEGRVVRHKARCVARGFTQQYGVNYWESVAPTVMSATVRTLLTLAAEEDLEVEQMDVTTAFLIPRLNEEIYMKQVPGFGPEAPMNKVWKLEKALYGLVQAAHEWNREIDKKLSSLGFIKAYADPCLYSRDGIHLAIYVDDIILVGKDMKKINIIKEELMGAYKMKDLGPISKFLGMQVVRDRTARTIHLSQQSLAEDILKVGNMHDAKPESTPYLSKDVWTEEHASLDRTEMDKYPYATIVGKLLYLATNTRPDLCTVVGLAGRFTRNYGSLHWTGIKRILKYLQGTKNYALKLGGSAESTWSIAAWSDADWAGDKDSRKSTGGMMIKLRGSPIIWRSKKQPIVARSTRDAEYVAASDASLEIIWLRQMMKGLIGKEVKAVLYCDNQGAIATVRNGGGPRAKHIDVRYRSIEQLVQKGWLEIDYVGTEDMIANIMTKPETNSRFQQDVRQLGVSNGTVQVNALSHGLEQRLPDLFWNQPCGRNSQCTRMGVSRGLGSGHEASQPSAREGVEQGQLHRRESAQVCCQRHGGARTVQTLWSSKGHDHEWPAQRLLEEGGCWSTQGRLLRAQGNHGGHGDGPGAKLSEFGHVGRGDTDTSPQAASTGDTSRVSTQALLLPQATAN